MSVIELKFGDGTFNVVPAPPAPSDSRGRRLHVVVVMDVSSSMQLTAAKKNANGEEEKFANSVLDLVKYATKAVYSMLDKDDYFTLITYGSDVTIKLECIAGSGNISILDQIHTSGCTNMGGGLKAALECVLRNEDKVGGDRQTAVMLLTDGAPNEGVNAATVLESFQANHPAMMARTVVNTYAFGYADDLAGDLMFEIAAKGNGTFGYIPDVGFLGTVFIHTMINLRSTTALLPQADIHNVQCEQVRCGISGVQFSPNRSTAAGSPQSQACLPVGFTNVVSGKVTIDDVRTALEGHKKDFGDEGFEKAVLEVFRGIHAQKACKSILECMGTPGPSEAKLYSLLEGNATDLSAVPHLSYDVEQQVAPAFRPEYFRRWGKQYLLSFVSAHLHQQCNNFKDKSVEGYKTAFALACHEEYDDIFNLLEPPKPTVMTQNTVRITSSRQFNSSRDPCVHQDCRILLASGAQKAVKDVVPGELVRTANGTAVEIDHVIRTKCQNGKSQMVVFPGSETGEGGLKITPWHPVMVQDAQGGRSWMLPVNAGYPVETCECDFVFSFTVKGAEEGRRGGGYEPGLIIEGVPVVHLAHGRSEPALLAHPFFGTNQVVDALPKGSRHHTFDSEPVLKGADGLACGWDMAKYVL